MADPVSVTALLAAVGLGHTYNGVPARTLERARLRGVALHAAIQYALEGDLDETSLPSEVAQPFAAWRRFAAEVELQPEAVEVELAHEDWGLIGHPDCVGLVRSVRAVLDWKFQESLDLAVVRLQLHAYRFIWQHARPTAPIHRCYAVQLKQDGTYRLHDLTDPDKTQVVLAALVLYREYQAREAMP